MQNSGLDVRWTALGVVDPDIASARSVIEWGGELQNTVDYVIVHNHSQHGVASSWENPKLEAGCGGLVGDILACRNTHGCQTARHSAHDADDEGVVGQLHSRRSEVVGVSHDGF
jgi:hypothetical protein